MSDFSVPLFLRGEVIEEDWVEFGGRGGACAFRAPNPHHFLDRLPLSSPAALRDLYEISLDEIVDVLVELGNSLEFDKNRYIREAYEAGLLASSYPASMLRSAYYGVKRVFARESILEIAERCVGIDYLEGWVTHRLNDGRDLSVRAFGARALHIPAGNGAVIASTTLIRNAITRSDAIIKIPSNDPLTAIALARTLADIAPNHPLTKHIAVGYWKGGDETVESAIYRPEHIEKIIAWGGFASMKHVTKYIQPGLELISLDPKRSATIIGPEAFAGEAIMHEVALRTACDIGTANQEGCACARVVYVLSGTDEAGMKNINRLGELVYKYLQELPGNISTKPKYFDRDLRDHLNATRMEDTFYRVFGGLDDEGAVIVSQMSEAVDYAPMLSGKVANLVPVDEIRQVTDCVNAFTQTIGIYPDSLKEQLRNILPLFGAQRLTSLGYACNVPSAKPQDAIEPLRRMCKWIVDEVCDPKVVTPTWVKPASR